MSYINNNLIKDEQVEYQASLHWIIFISLSSLFTLGILPMIRHWTTECAITNKRVIIKTGLIERNTFEMNLNKIESVNVDQSILGRILGYGTITLIGTGGTREEFEDLKDPVTFRKRFQELSV